MRALWLGLACLLLAIVVAVFIAERGYDRLKWSGASASDQLAGRVGSITLDGQLQPDQLP
jgi:hypothetical protein